MIDIVDTAMILAAGFGKRLQPLIGDLPKPLVDINGKSALEIGIEGLNHSDFCQEIVINTHWQSQKIHQAVDLFRIKIKKQIRLVDEKPEILETGGGIMNAMKITGSDVLLVKNSDIIFFSNDDLDPYTNILRHWDNREMDALLLLRKKKIGTKGDFCIGYGGRIIRDPVTNDYDYTGCCILSSRFFAEKKSISSFSITEILFQATPLQYMDYNFHGVILPESIDFCDIGTPDNLIVARDKAMYCKNLW